ncbi:MAG: beta-phosphoglucomutase family hydrolase [Solirubrobacterales bacterium]
MTPEPHAKSTAAVGLPAWITACLFDLDGVLTKTAVVHGAAWKQMFDDFLRKRADRLAEPFVEFDTRGDYERYVDGKPRFDGVRSFLASRRIDLPEGSDDDPESAETIRALGNRKNQLVLELLDRDGVEAYPGSVGFVRAALAAGLRCAVVSSSANCEDVLRAAGLRELFEVVVDGKVAARDGLAGKPAPDTFKAAALALDTDPAHAAVFEDALAGVEAGRAGDFGFVVGVDRVGQAAQLKQRGADIVVRDLAELMENK